MKEPILVHGKWQEKLNDILDDIDIKKAVIVTDPPFNIGYHYKGFNDKKKKDVYYDELVEICSKTPHVLIHYPESLFEYSVKSQKVPEKVVSWVYNSNTAKQHRDIAFYGVKPDFRKVGQPYKNPNDKRIKERIAAGKTARLYDWWNINQVKNVSKEKCDHPCQMPLEVMENIVGILPDDAIIIDPFTGTGTTGLACLKYDKQFIGIEMIEDYYEIAKKRLEEYEK